MATTELVKVPSKRKLAKPRIKKSKFSNMTEEIWKETNEQSKESRGISNITYKDLFRG
ncbi:hypothetical protein [Sporosarcina sp. G11-34]|uniref:hypothetical protein n=1 Tax=Sporosarcina sp. G11-34 TaxID=2849605 RepID=UPI0022A934F2|nr:hypothetical protein [Sporosarcina sp. G11-34]MCZ2259850.1 hypothetical protein [Sporosarcina sp. G11-34]